MTISPPSLEPDPPFVRKTDGQPAPPQDSPYHCSAEWHLAALRPICALIHGFALHIGWESRTFSCSAVNMAEYLQRNESTIRAGYKELEDLGFFEKKIQGRFNSSVYRVLNHEEWAKKNPGRCVQKLDFGWKDDPLGQRLYIASGMRVKWREQQINALRNVGSTDERIVEEFERYYELEGQRKKPSNVPIGFIYYFRNCSLGPSLSVQ